MGYPIISKEQLLFALQKSNKRILALGVKHLGFFGTETPGSINFYVEFEEGKKNFDNFMELADLLGGITERKVELLTPEVLNKRFGQDILKEVEYVNLTA